MADTETRKTGALQHSKVFYRPIEAAIRWSRLIRFETRILDILGAKQMPDAGDFPRWPMLHLNTERMFDAIRNGDLPYGKAGITYDDPSLINDPDLTVRHVDLKTWMSRFYPDQRPAFLFDAIERQLHPAIRIETIQTLLAEQEALRIRLADREQSFSTLHEQHKLLCRQAESWGSAGREVTPRSETTYLNIVGGLLTLLLGKSPGGMPYSSFETMDSIISALLAHYEGRPGISERTLWAKFAEAKRHLDTSTR
jgi:hypothetical protein